MDFLDSSHGWVVGEQGTILRTIDGGGTWAACGVDSEYHLSTVQALGTGEAWAAGGIEIGAEYTPVVIGTSDGGATWQTLYSSTKAGYINSLECSAVDTAWAVGENGLVLHTTDHASTWSGLRLGRGSSLSDVQRVDQLTLWVCGTGGGLSAHNRCRLWKSRDGGVTWRRQDPPTRGSLVSVALVSPMRGMIAGSNGAILRTSDAGRSWRSARRAVSWYDLDMATARVGYAVGAQTAGFEEQAGVLYASRDGGKSWKRRFAVKAGSLAAVDVVPASQR